MLITTMQELESSLKSSKTSKVYYYALKSYLAYRKLSSLEELLVNTSTTTTIINTKVIESQIIDYITYLKLVKKTSYAYRNLQLAAIKHFYRMNDIELNWFKINNI